MLSRLLILFSLMFVLNAGKGEPLQPASFKLGNEKLLENLDRLSGKRIALITNQTGVDSKGNFFLDRLISRKVNVVKLFSPEHGIRGNEDYKDIDIITGVPIVSIYGAKTAPAPEDLTDVDILIYDVQDVGSRFYTYTSTLYYCIDAALANNKKIIICDRPVVINANYSDGFMLDTLFKSFVGTIPAPVCYGMTCGELAMYLNEDIFGRSNLVDVSEMENYTRETDYTKLDLPWIKPSPNMLTAWTAICYPASCFLEGTNVSEGRGTPKPFEYIGAPWVNGQKLADELNEYNFEGVTFNAITFTPSVKISDYPPKFFNIQCSGLFINVTDKYKFEPVKTGIAILISLKKLFPEFQFNENNFIDKLAGTDRLRLMIEEGADLQKIVTSWQNELKIFKQKRQSVLLYN